MRTRGFLLPVWIVMVTGMLAGCGSSGTRTGNDWSSHLQTVPQFNADTAYAYVRKQVSFGPRVPDSPAHARELAWLTHQLGRYAGAGYVFTQRFTVTGYQGDTLHLANVIAAFNPGARDRVMLCAHWDTRPRSDQDPDSAYRDKPIPGADDGGSGVAVLLELARQMHQRQPAVGVDLVFFDGEDYGREQDENYYYLGSRYWAKNPPVPGYHPRFGILLDMVGGKNAHFPKEGTSYRFAPALVDNIWKVAGEIGYGKLFTGEVSPGVDDDHTVLNQNLTFPTIDIINHRTDGRRTLFPDYWHTHRDDLPIIDTRTLKAVGQLMLEITYNRL